MTFIDRRTAMGGLGALIARPVFADDAPVSPVAHGILADNALARAFEPPSDEKFPDVFLWTPTGRYHIDALKGFTVLMPLWAEWCAPCFSEMPDFARLQAKYGNSKFMILPVLTGTQKKFTPENLGPFLASAHAGIFAPVIENDHGDTLLHKMATIRHRPNSYAVPCNLLIAPDGRVVAREMGRISAENGSSDPPPATTAKEMLARTEAGAVQSLWGQQPGEEFAKAMAEGFLG